MTTLVTCLERRALEQPNRTLFGFFGADRRLERQYTYAEFARATRQLAAALADAPDLAWGERVLLAYPAGLELLLAFFACARRGLIPVPVAPPGGSADALERLTGIAADCGARAVLYSQAALGPVARSQLGQKLCLIDTQALAVAEGEALEERAHPTLFLQYTSGSTGRPRGVVVSHANIIANAESTLDHVPIGVSWLPQHHDMGLIGYALFPVVRGGTSFGFSAADFLRRPASWFEYLSRTRATYASSPNFGLEYCLRSDRLPSDALQGIDLSALEVFMNAAEPVRPDTLRRFRERFAPYGLRESACVVAYGLAENTLTATHHGRRLVYLDHAELERGAVKLVGAGTSGATPLVSCGKPVPGVELRIVDPASCQARAERELGEVWLSGPSVCSGYWGRGSDDVFEQRLAESRPTDATYLRTGDQGFVDGGELFVCGRLKDLIIVRGANYYPQDIETVVEAQPAVRPGTAVAYGGQDGTLEVVFESSPHGEAPDLPNIAVAVGRRCGVQPDRVLCLPLHSVARTTSGKLARSETRRRVESGRATPLFSYRRPKLGGVGALRARFHDVLERLQGLDAEHATLVDAGLDSLTLADIAFALEDEARRQAAPDLADSLGLALLQYLTPALFERLLACLDDGNSQVLAAMAEELKSLRLATDSGLREHMQHDARLLPDDTPRSPAAGPLEEVLLTGPTGFFGPLLLSSLLARTPYVFHLLVRAADRSSAWQRVLDALKQVGWATPAIERVASRLRVYRGDIAQPSLGLAPHEWEELAGRVQAVVHNAAVVNYVASYRTMSPANVFGTREALRFAHTARTKEFHFISSTFIFGWTLRGLLMENDDNDAMSCLDFGYSQSKWVAEQLVLEARRRGLPARIYRPSLLSVSTMGHGDTRDVAVRLIAFMINHGIAVDTSNQLSLLPADVAAQNIATIFSERGAPSETFHVTVGQYYNIKHVTELLTTEYGYRFEYYAIPEFISELNRRCTKSDLLFPLLDFFNRSAAKVAAMQLKRYDNRCYRAALDRARAHTPEPSVDETVRYLVGYLRTQGLIRAPLPPAAARRPQDVVPSSSPLRIGPPPPSRKKAF